MDFEGEGDRTFNQDEVYQVVKEVAREAVSVLL